MPWSGFSNGFFNPTGCSLAVTVFSYSDGKLPSEGPLKSDPCGGGPARPCVSIRSDLRRYRAAFWIVARDPNREQIRPYGFHFRFK